MAKPKDLIAVHVPTEDLGDYNVTETGWYAIDDGGKVVLGPFDSLAQCERAIRDERQRIIPKVPGLADAGAAQSESGKARCSRYIMPRCSNRIGSSAASVAASRVSKAARMPASIVQCSAGRGRTAP